MSTTMKTVSTLALFFVNFALSPGVAVEDPSCLPPPPHERHAVRGCCKSHDPWKDEEMHKALHECFEESGIKKPHHGDHEHGHPPPPPDPAVFECVSECVLKKMNLVGEDGELKKDDIKERIAKDFSDEWESVGMAAFEKCFASAKESVSESAKCKSGSEQLFHCFGREIFLNCPTHAWTESDECNAVKERLSKCPGAKAPLFYKH